MRNRLLRFREAWSPPLGGAFNGLIYRSQGIGLVDNSEQDLREVVEEMLDRLDTRWVETPGNAERQAAYDALAREFGSFGCNSRVGARFLERYRRLLG